jgi:hypothetical protein
LVALAQAPYEEVTDRFVRWSSETDPPVRRVGDAWSVTSKEDAWSLLVFVVPIAAGAPPTNRAIESTA